MRLLRRLFELLPKSDKPILTRYYVLRTKHLKWFGIKIHHIKQSELEFHTHPWWGFSIIFGQYAEMMEDEQGHGCIKWCYARKLFNIISPKRAHRVLVQKPVWTLFFHGPRVDENWHSVGKTAAWRGPDQT